MNMSYIRSAACLALVFIGSIYAQEDNPPSSNPGPIPLSSIQVIQRSTGVYVYTYRETMDPIDPYTDFETKRRITDSTIIDRLKRILAENAAYTPDFRARCLPMWEYGLEFRESETEKRTFLFSFRCNQLKLVEERIYRDFSPQRTELYALLRYELNDQTTAPISAIPQRPALADLLTSLR